MPIVRRGARQLAADLDDHAVVDDLAQPVGRALANNLVQVFPEAATSRLSQTTWYGSSRGQLAREGCADSRAGTGDRDVHARRVSRVRQRAGIWIVSDRPPAVAVNVTGWPLAWSVVARTQPWL